MVGMERKPSSCDACDDAFFHQTGDAEHDARTIDRCGEYSIVQGLCCSVTALMGRLVACCISCGFAPFLSACILRLFLSSTHFRVETPCSRYSLATLPPPIPWKTNSTRKDGEINSPPIHPRGAGVAYIADLSTWVGGFGGRSLTSTLPIRLP